MDSLVIFLRPRIPSWIWIRYIQYATHKNNFTSPTKLAMLIVMSNSAPAPSDYFTFGQHFLETFTLLHEKPEPQTNGDFNVYFLKQQTWLLLHIVQQHTLLSQLSHNSISSLYFFPFPRGLQHKRKLCSPCGHEKLS